MAELDDLRQKFEQAKSRGDRKNMDYFARQIQALQNRGGVQPANIGNQNTQPDANDDDDEDDSSVPFGVPLDEENQPATPPTRGEEGVAELTDAARDDLARAAQQQRAAAMTPPQQESVPPEAAVPAPGIAGDVTPAPAQKPADSAQPQQPPSSAPPAAETTDGRQSPQKPTAEGAADQAKQQAEGQAKKAAGQAIKAALKSAWTVVWGFIVANAWWIVPVVIILIIAIALFAYFYSSADSGANGKTPVQAASAIDDKSALQKLSLLAGDRDTQQKLSADVLTTKILPNLTALKDKTTDDTLKKQIDDALKAANDCASTPPKTEACTSLIDLIKAILIKFDDPIPPIQGRAPVNPEDTISGDHFNADLHIGTPLHPMSSKDTQTTGHGTYIYTGQDKGDAVDVYTKPGTKIYPAFTGDISVSDDASGIAGVKKVVIKHGDYQILYAFITPSVKDGDQITDQNKNNPIGTAGSINGANLVHVEFIYCSTALVTNELDRLDKDGLNGGTPMHTTWGAYYWDHLKKILKF